MKTSIKATGSHSVAIRVPNDLYDKLVKAAKADRRPLSQKIVVMLEDALVT